MTKPVLPPELAEEVDPATILVRGGAMRSGFDETCEALYLSSGFVYGSAAEAEEAFVVVHHSCAALTYSIAHEIGHIIGARHDKALDQNETPFAYGHGFVNGSKWRDVMSYKASCNGCPRVPIWSNPRIKYKGDTAGALDADNPTPSCMARRKRCDRQFCVDRCHRPAGMARTSGSI